MAKKYLDDNGLLYLWGKIKSALSGKVDKDGAKVLSTNDYTTAEKNKLAGIAPGAEANVNADWDAASGDAQILNKPSIPSKTSDLTNDSGFITASDVPDGATASTTTPKMDGTAAVGTETAFARGDHRHPSDTAKQDVISDLDTIRAGAALGATSIQEHQSLAAYAPLASPALTGTPTVPTAAAGTNTTQAASTAFVKAAIDNAVNSVMHYKGTKATYADLPSTGNTVGDVWNVTAAYGDYPAGTNWAWNGSEWDPQGGAIDLSGFVQTGDITEISNAEIDTIVAS